MRTNLSILFKGYGPFAALSKGLLAIPFLALPALADPVTLLAFGDSLTQGYGLAEADGFVPQLEAWLNANGAEVRVINGGVSGDTTAGGAARIAWSLTPEVDAVLVALGGNDMLRGIDPAATRANLEAILTEISAHGLPTLLVGIEAPGNFGAEYKATFDAVYPELATQFGVPLYPEFMAGLAALGDRQRVVRDYLQSDATHPNAVGVKLIVEAIGPIVVNLISQTAAQQTGK